MTCSTSFLNRLLILLFCLALLFAGSLEAAEQPVAEESKDIAPPVFRVTTDLPSPQVAGQGEVVWSAVASDEGKAATLEFELKEANGTLRKVQAGEARTWQWHPEHAGTYQVRATARNSTGLSTAGPWSASFEIVPQLVAEDIKASRPSPQMAGSKPVRWSVSARGGVGPLTYDFELERDGDSRGFSSGSEGGWSWPPDMPGDYRVRALVTDSRGNLRTTGWSEIFKVTPPLTVGVPSASKDAPQMAGTGPISWTLKASGGVPPLTYAFEVEKDGAAQGSTQTDAAVWPWWPEQAGSYRVRGLVTDSRGNTALGAWSAPFEVAPPLTAGPLGVDQPAPQMAGAGPLTWNIAAQGGVGELTYEFELEKDGAVLGRSPGLDGVWAWSPQEAGSYRVRAFVTDRLGNRLESEWSAAYLIVPALTLEPLTVTKPSPQMAGSGEITWTARATGGIGDRNITFEVQQGDGAPQKVASGSGANWVWPADRPGYYRVRAQVVDSRGHRSEGLWYGYQLAPRLVVGAPKPGKPAPQAAQTKPLAWMIEATGGVEPRSYRFEWRRDGGAVEAVETGNLPGWAMRPMEAGAYQVRVAVTDLRGNQVVSSWSEPYAITPPLVVDAPIAGMAGPQMAGSVQIPWSVRGEGGVGARTFVFELAREGSEPTRMPASEALTWTWEPAEAGVYRVRAVMTDGIGNQQTSDWSVPFAIEPALRIESLSSDRPAPQAARTVAINWVSVASGGVGEKSYKFQLRCNDDEASTVQEGKEPAWLWAPANEGVCRVRLEVTDVLGNSVTSAWTEPYRIAPPLEISAPAPDREASQYLLGSRIAWSVQAVGGVGRPSVSFLLEKKGESIGTTQTGAATSWRWQSAEVGFYRIGAVMTDALGNRKEGAWSDWKEIRPPLALESFRTAANSPQPALKEPIPWQVRTTGGIGLLSYDFLSIKGGVESLEQSGSAPELNWMPVKAGVYRLKVRVTDEENHQVESDWSDEFRIDPTINGHSLVAFLPVENLSTMKAPLNEIDHTFSALLSGQLRFYPEKDLNDFMRAYRMRDTGGLNAHFGQALKDEAGVDAVLITTLETWHEANPPRVSLIARLVTTGATPEIVWIDSVGLTGEDEPGLLGLGRIKSPKRLMEMALERLAVSLKTYLSGHFPSYRHSVDGQTVSMTDEDQETAEPLIDRVKGRYWPQSFYRASSFDPAAHYRVAVVPFLNINTRKNAGKIIALHLTKQLHRYANLRVFEPGMIRNTLLKYRMIMQSGPSLAASDVLARTGILGADLVISGRVFDYQGDIGISKVDFSTQVFDSSKREVVWASRSSATGDKGVYFFDLGKIPSAHGLASRMAQAVVRQMEE